jgi:hypothetical protein
MKRTKKQQEALEQLERRLQNIDWEKFWRGVDMIVGPKADALHKAQVKSLEKAHTRVMD